MACFVRPALFGLGLVIGIIAAAEAQSISALPPRGPSTAPTAKTPPFSSTQSVYPKPGGNSVWRDQHYHPAQQYDADKSQHPYSTSIGPKPGSNSSTGENHYQPTDEDSDPARHPYTAKGVGPKPN